MHVIAGFESHIAAHGGAIAITDAARDCGVTVHGVALARMDTQRGIRIDPLPRFPMPEHVLQTLDRFFTDGTGQAQLQTGDTALVVSLANDRSGDPGSIANLVRLESRGALWVMTTVE